MRWIIAIAVVSLAALSIVGRRWSLIDRLALAMVASAVISFPWGIWLSLQMNLTGRVRDSQRVFVHIAIAMLFGICGIIVVRDAVEALAFLGMSPRATGMNAFVVDHYSTKSGKKASVSLAPGTQRQVTVTPELYNLLDRSSPGGDCLAVTVETGRWGLRRVDLPRPLIDPPYGMDRYVSCNQRHNH